MKLVLIHFANFPIQEQHNAAPRGSEMGPIRHGSVADRVRGSGVMPHSRWPHAIALFRKIWPCTTVREADRQRRRRHVQNEGNSAIILIV